VSHLSGGLNDESEKDRGHGEKAGLSGNVKFQNRKQKNGTLEGWKTPQEAILCASRGKRENTVKKTINNPQPGPKEERINLG